MHNSIVHTENGFRGVADRGKRCDQPTTMSSAKSALSPFNTEQRTLAAFPRYAIFCTSLSVATYWNYYVKCAALYWTFIPQSFWNTRCGHPRVRKFHLTRSLVVFGGWSSVRGRTNRKHCPSHKIWSYKGDGRW